MRNLSRSAPMLLVVTALVVGCGQNNNNANAPEDPSKSWVTVEVKGMT